MKKLMPLKILLLLVWTGVATIAAQYIIAFPMVWIFGPERVSEPVWTTVYTATAYVLALALVMFGPILLGKIIKKLKKSNSKTADLFLKEFKITREELGLKDWPTFRDIGLAPIAFVAYFALAAIFTAFMSIFPWFDISQAQDVGFNNLGMGLDRIVAFIALVVCAPIAEELIFRGWLYGKLRKKIKLVPSILLVSALFGLLHGQWNVGVNVFAMSIILCLQREFTGTIYSGILLHMLKNGVAFYLLYVM